MAENGFNFPFGAYLLTGPQEVPVELLGVSSGAGYDIEYVFYVLLIEQETL